MNNNELVIRQQRLLMRSGELRLALINQAQVFKRPLALADLASSGLKWFYHHPEWPLGALFFLLVLRPRRAIVWSFRLWRTWKKFKKVQLWLANLPLR